ncbi:MAG: hypothetical protein N2C14_21305 [Planctomycetales bacterium]
MMNPRLQESLSVLSINQAFPLFFIQHEADARSRREGIEAMMPDLNPSDWFPLAIILAGLIVIFSGLIGYSAKGFTPLPATKPMICMLPKFIVPLQIEGEDVLRELSARLARHGFRELRRDAGAVVFTRGSKLGEFSIKVMKLYVMAALPLSNPVQLRVVYGAPFGVVFDTGDLWTFCRELIEKVEAVEPEAEPDLPRREPMETGNPYQSPRS